MTTPDAPRHLTPTPEERSKILATRAASGSGQGLTRFYRPVGPPSFRSSEGGYGGVVTGESGSDAISITSTESGGGSSSATGDFSIAAGYFADSPAAQGIAAGFHATAEQDRSIAVGPDAHTHGTPGDGFSGAIAVGFTAATWGVGVLAIGVAASVGSAMADANNAAAIGPGATAPNTNDFVLGNSANNVQVPGKLIIADASGGLHQIVVSTGGALSTVAYP